MKKLLACGLVLSILASVGSVCFATDPDKQDHPQAICYPSQTFKGRDLYAKDERFWCDGRYIGPYQLIALYNEDSTVHRIIKEGWSGPEAGRYLTNGPVHNVEFYMNNSPDRMPKAFTIYMNIGDGKWREVMQFTGLSDTEPSNNLVSLPVRPEFQYKFVAEFDDRPQEEEIMMGQELFELYGVYSAKIPASDWDDAVIHITIVRAMNRTRDGKVISCRDSIDPDAEVEEIKSVDGNEIFWNNYTMKVNTKVPEIFLEKIDVNCEYRFYIEYANRIEIRRLDGKHLFDHFKFSV